MKQGRKTCGSCRALEEVREKLQNVRCRAWAVSGWPCQDVMCEIDQCIFGQLIVVVIALHSLPYATQSPEDLEESRCQDSCRLIYNHYGLQYLELRVGAHGASVTRTLPCATSVENKDACLKKGGVNFSWL